MSVKSFILVSFSALALTVSAMAQDGLPYKVLGDPSGTSPYFFGPNAFPIPDMVKDTKDKVTAELSGDYFSGRLASEPDRTGSVGFAVRIPLWTDRVNLSVYGQMHEWYSDNPEVRALRGVSGKYPLTGHCSGDVYVSTDMRILDERKFVPALTLRAALKSASGDEYEKARYFDAPGYHFDICATKSFPFAGDGFLKSFKASFNFGFLCWQTDIGCQNDAWIVAGSLELDTAVANLSADLGGYYGREEYYDRPASLKIKLDIIPDRMVSPFLYYQHGIRHWPFDQFRAGVRFSFAPFRGARPSL